MDTAPRDTDAAPCPDPGMLAAFMDGALDEADRSRVESHLAACPPCLETIAVAARVPAPALLPQGLAVRPRRALALAAAASFLALAAAGWLVVRTAPPHADPGRVPDVALAPVQAPSAGAVQSSTGLELAGGFLAASNDSEVTSLCVQSDGDTLRWALVRGSVFVELGPQAPPVRVVTPHASVTIHPGETRVNVGAAQTDVLVASGRAVVEGSAGGEALALAAGQAAAAAAKRAPEAASREAKGSAPEWVQAARARHLEAVMTSAIPLQP